MFTPFLVKMAPGGKKNKTKQWLLLVLMSFIGIEQRIPGRQRLTSTGALMRLKVDVPHTAYRNPCFWYHPFLRHAGSTMLCANSNSQASFTYMWLHASCNNSPLHKGPWAWNHLRELWLLLHSPRFLWRQLTSVISFNPLYPTSLTLSLPIAATYGTICLTWKKKKTTREGERDEGERRN